jgi:phospholipid-binding lipoprotein MlaA
MGFVMQKKLYFFRMLLVVFLVFGTLGGCAQEVDQLAEEQVYDNNDPIESINRAIFAFNDGLDTILIRPVAQAYRWVTPDPVRNSIRNFLDNLRSPVVLLNEVLQAEFERAGVTVARFIVNSTVGVAGLFDVAEYMGLEGSSHEDFGQTLGTWGMDEGFYLVLPIIGPSSARDAVGKVVDIFLDPLTYIANDTENEWYLYTRAAVDGIDKRSRNIETLDQLKRDSVDFYASVRNIYRQHRAQQINNGQIAYEDDPYLAE